MALGTFGACKGGKANGAAPPESRDPSAQSYVQPPLPGAHVVLTDALGGLHAVDVEVAATENSRARGMMWRTELAVGKGMLFVFPTQENHSFWMKNTLIPLDLIFIDKDGRIVGVIANAEPQSLKSRSPGKASKFVLEVPAGWTQRTAIAVGSQVRIDGLANIHVE